MFRLFSHFNYYKKEKEKEKRRKKKEKNKRKAMGFYPGLTYFHVMSSTKGNVG
jgi:hypothetical protein